MIQRNLYEILKFYSSIQRIRQDGKMHEHIQKKIIWRRCNKNTV